LKYII